MKNNDTQTSPSATEDQNHQDSVQSGKQASIEAAAREALDRHAPVSQDAGSGSPMGDTPSAPINPLFSRPLVKRTAVQVTKTVGKRFDRKIGRLALAVSEDREFASNIVQETAVQPEEADNIGELFGIVCEKYQEQLQFAPEGALIISVLAVGVRYYSAIGDLQSMVAEKRAAQAKMQGQGTALKVGGDGPGINHPTKLP